MSREGYNSSAFSSRRAFRYAPLFVALGFAASAHAANIITVDSADITSAPDKCTIIDAVTALNTQTQVNGCAPGNGDDDTIDLTILPDQTTISLMQAVPGTGYALVLHKEAIFRGAVVNGTPSVTLERSVVSGTNFGLIQSNYPLSLYGLTLTNGASGTYVGGAVVAGGTLTMGDCVVSNSKSDSAGGGIAVSGPLTIHHSTITGNTAGNAGGGIESSSSAAIYDSIISNNATLSSSGDGGGGISASASLSIHETTLSGNTSAADGGAIAGSNIVNIDSSTISGNTAHGPGGGVRGGTVDLTESTVTGNSTTGTGGGVDADMLTSTYSTIAQNSSTGIGGGGGVNFASGADAQGSIFYGNTPDDLASTAALQGNLNLVGTTTVTTPADTISCDPKLDVLADNGGPTQTMALLAQSCAIDAASATPVSGTDQRGFARPAVTGTNADIGAYESGATDPDVIFRNGFES